MNKLFIFLLFVLVGCASMTMAEKEQKRGELDAMFAAGVAAFIEQDPEVEEELEASVGYAVASMQVTKIPFIGWGGGEAVLIDNSTQQRGYYTISRFDVGGGFGVRAYKVLMVFASQAIVDKWKTGKWEFKAGAEASAGTAGADGGFSGTGFTMYTLSEGGASATVTARVIRVKVNRALAEPL